MGDDAINRANDKAYLVLESAKYCSESKRFTYENYVLIFEKNMCILSRNNEEIRDTRAVQKFLSGIEFPWFVAGKYFVTGLDAHKNDFAKTMEYLASFVQHGKGRVRNISAFHAQGSSGRRHGGIFGHGGRSGGGSGGRGGRGGCGCGIGRGPKPNISARSNTDQEWYRISYDEKGKVFALHNKAEPRMINEIDISEFSVDKIAKIAAGQNDGLGAAGEKDIPSNLMTGKTCGSVLSCCSVVSGLRLIWESIKCGYTTGTRRVAIRG